MREALEAAEFAFFCVVRYSHAVSTTRPAALHVTSSRPAGHVSSVHKPSLCSCITCESHSACHRGMIGCDARKGRKEKQRATAVRGRRAAGGSRAPGGAVPTQPTWSEEFRAHKY